MISLPLSRSVMISEIQGAQAILEKWRKILALEENNGIPGVDYDAPPQHTQECMTQMKAELVVCAGKCENLAEAIHDWLR